MLRLLVAFTATLFALGSCTRFDATAPATLSRYEFSEPHMGLPFRIVLYANTESQAKTAASDAFARIQELNDILSDYDFESELSGLSHTSGTGDAVKVSDDLWNVLKRSQELAKKSRGAFDITVGPAVNLWRKARRERRMPDEKLLAEARNSMGYKNLVLNQRNRTAKLLAPGMRLDLGGIAKGYAIDEALEVLKKYKIRAALVAGGGDIAVSDAPPGKKGWRIEIAPLDVPNAPPREFVSLKNAALATSGDIFQHLVIDGQRFSHIVDPRTGIGLTDHSLITIIAKDCMTADSLATAASVLGPRGALELIEDSPAAEGHIVQRPDEKIEVFESSNFKKFYE